MDGAQELRQLAHLFRVTADTLRQIATIRQADANDICVWAAQVSSVADGLDKIASRPRRSNAI